MRYFAVLLFSLIHITEVCGWGFFAHQRINRLAVFTLPPEMITFYKAHIVYLTENAVNPDNRRYTVEGEAPRHYIDADLYGDSAVFKLPRYWKDAVEKYGEDSLMENGINPWFVHRMKLQLTDAFQKMDGKSIIRISADLGHYIADGNVPLHSTHNYNGQYTGQYGIHGFWESRLPELFAHEYDFFVGQATYLKNTQLRAWQATTEAHLALDSVFGFEKLLTKRFSEDRKYGFEERNGQTVKVYSRDFAKAYHDMLNGQVERRMRASIKMIGDFWYTAWVDAGQPDLSTIVDLKFTEEEKQELERERNQWKEDAKIRPEAFIPGSEHMDHHDCCCSYMHLLTYKNLLKNLKTNVTDEHNHKH